MQELIRKEALKIDREPHTWQDAIRVAGKMLLEAGSIEEGYIDAMIDAVHQLGPYIAIAPHIAIAHAAPGTHVIKDDMIMIVFKEPVLFNSENDPVHLMIGMCALEAHSHLDQFTGLADIMDDENIWQEFLACETVDQMYALTNKKSN